MTANARAMVIRRYMALFAFGTDIFAALIEKYIVRSAYSLIESSWFEYQMSSRSRLGGGVRNSFPFCILFDSIQSSSVTNNLSYVKPARQGNNTMVIPPKGES